MKPLLNITGLCRRYDGFALEDVSFAVPSGSIVGLIGENGAGKSTTLHAVLGLIRRDSGGIELLGKHAEALTPADREQIGVVFDGSNFSPELTPARLNKVLREVCPSWDEPLFGSLLARLQVPAGKKIHSLSKGTKMKLSLAVALAHHPRLLILDEATAGLDPVVREDILDLFLDFVQDEEHGILVSSHITSDLEKVADHIVFLHQGRVVFSKPKDELLDRYGILQCGAEQFARLDKADAAACRRQDFGWQVLVTDRAAAAKKYPGAVVAPATIDEIMLLYVKGAAV